MQSRGVGEETGCLARPVEIEVEVMEDLETRSWNRKSRKKEQD